MVNIRKGRDYFDDNLNNLFPEDDEAIDYLFDTLKWHPTFRSLLIELDKDMRRGDKFSAYKIFDLILASLDRDRKEEMKKSYTSYYNEFDEVEMELLYPYLRRALKNRDGDFIAFMAPYLGDIDWIVTDDKVDLEDARFVIDIIRSFGGDVMRVFGFSFSLNRLLQRADAPKDLLRYFSNEL